MRALKALVIVMGVLIVAGFAFVIVTIVGRVSGPDPVETLGQLSVQIDPGCRLADAWSADALLYLRLTGAETCDTILLVQPKDGKVVGRISVSDKPAPGAAAPVE